MTHKHFTKIKIPLFEHKIGCNKNIQKKTFYSKGPKSRSQTPIQCIFITKGKGPFFRIKQNFQLA